MVFRAFSKMIEGLPAPAVIKALEAQCRMLESDIEHKRLTTMEDALSILSFRHFVRMAQGGDVARCSRPLPVDHVEFYRTVTARLVDARELPSSAMEQFDFAFVN